ncbi:hypothetical protein [Paucibacter sp. M5-1]|uniref:hypothetical protein n=1 Tax=Paucibacter sp. M5-1 TaxID=3015998 RepID=UPI0022B913C9|nr:hypothetical protein [Paucibacter sp. M5-1]MCZ7881514.1 hypothetical protein [Paucibacter sp. M5-1]
MTVKFNSKGMCEKAAWELHEEFKSDMRGFRDEEYRLADMYIKVVSFVSAGIVAALSFFQNTAGLLLTSYVIATSHVVLWLIVCLRIWRSHTVYSELKRNVEDIRINFAKGSYAGQEPSGASPWGANMQMLTISLVMIVAVSSVIIAAYNAHEKANLRVSPNSEQTLTK